MLKNKVAFVTGASRGIGREIAITLAEYGADIIINYNGNQIKAEETAEIIRTMGRKVLILRGSVSDSEQVRFMVDEAINEFGKVDILVNNAGITKDNLVLKMTEQDFQEVLDVNLNGSFYTIKHLYKNFLKQRSGRIINLTSVSGLLGNAGQANYSASKAGVIGLTKSLARELSSRNVTVNAVAPGYIDTDMTQAISESAREKLLETIPLKRMGSPREIAEMVAFLASDKASYITGQVISVDGGMAI